MDVSPELERVLVSLPTLTAEERRVVLDTLYRMEDQDDD